MGATVLAATGDVAVITHFDPIRKFERLSDLAAMAFIEDEAFVADRWDIMLVANTVGLGERVVGVQAGTAVAETGRRLKKGWNPVIVTFFVLIVAYNFAGAFLPPAISGFLALGVFALIATVTLASIGKAIRQRTR